MNILHYSLGFPPYRSGGMTTYCISLIREQKAQGHTVSMMWPGAYSIISSKTRIVDSVYKLDNLCVKSFEIRNGLPVPLLDGIRDIEAFSKSVNKEVFVKFFTIHKFDVLHVHTLMGLPYECIEAAKECRIKTYFTSHDSFGICCKQGLFVNGKICDDHECLHCYDCNNTALSLMKISILQSPVYRELKDSALVKLLRKRHNDQVFSSGDKKELTENIKQAGKYRKLRKYYVGLLNSFDLILYNSTLMRDVYKSFGINANYTIFPVSHKNIKPSFIEKKETNVPVNIAYFGPINVHKGYYFLIDVLNGVYKESKNFRLHVFNKFDHTIPYVINHNPYKYSELLDIMKEIDLVAVPSQCYETFGFNTLEALSYGVPVIVSENVGAKDMIKNGKNGFILSSKDEWIDGLLYLINNPSEIISMNRWVEKNQYIMSFAEYTRKLLDIYEGEEHGRLD